MSLSFLGFPRVQGPSSSLEAGFLASFRQYTVSGSRVCSLRPQAGLQHSFTGQCTVIGIRPTLLSLLSVVSVGVVAVAVAVVSLVSALVLVVVALSCRPQPEPQTGLLPFALSTSDPEAQRSRPPSPQPLRTCLESEAQLKSLNPKALNPTNPCDLKAP